MELGWMALEMMSDFLWAGADEEEREVGSEVAAEEKRANQLFAAAAVIFKKSENGSALLFSSLSLRAEHYDYFIYLILMFFF